jgi:ribosome maturation factor RimP
MVDFKTKVHTLLEAGLLDKPSLFLVDCQISNTNKILITLDGDQGVNLQDCIDISRAVEHNLDREEVDFELEVASAGVSSPLKLKRQYTKNIGRTLIVKTNDKEIEALLEATDDQGITLSWTERQPKKIGKGKENVLMKVKLNYEDIKEAIVTITF